MQSSNSFLFFLPMHTKITIFSYNNIVATRCYSDELFSEYGRVFAKLWIVSPFHTNLGI